MLFHAHFLSLNFPIGLVREKKEAGTAGSGGPGGSVVGLGLFMLFSWRQGF